MTKTSSSAKKSRGKLVVIDGTDGTGKTTQTALLVKRLKKEKKSVGIADFPRYGLESAYFVEQYLNGRYGGLKDINAYAASLFYALDRFDARATMERQLDEGKIIVSNRYVTANMGHQGGKITSTLARRRYLRWLDSLEHDLLGIPRPDCTIILHVPAAIAQRLVDRKGRRDYIRRKRDLHEADLKHLQAAERTYLEIARRFGYSIVECAPKGKMLTPEAIHEQIWKIVDRVVR